MKSSCGDGGGGGGGGGDGGCCPSGQMHCWL